MAFGQNPTTSTQGSLATNQFPVPSLAVPGTANGDLIALEGAFASTDSNTNKTAPASMISKLHVWAAAGNMFTASTDRQLTAGAGIVGFTLFCNNIAKNVMILAARVSLNNNQLAGDFSKLTAANTLANALAPVNHNFGSGTTSLVSTTWATSSVSPSGTNIGTFTTTNPGQVELLASTPGRVLYIPANTTLGLGIWPNVPGVGYVGIDVTWVEF